MAAGYGGKKVYDFKNQKPVEWSCLVENENRTTVN
jgi:hypothetical protein